MKVIRSVVRLSKSYFNDNIKLRPIRIDRNKLIDKYFKYGYHKYVYYSDSIEHYIERRKPSYRRRFIYHSITGHLFVVFLVYCLITVYSDRNAIRNLGIPYFALFPERKTERIVYAMYSFVMLTMFFIRLIIFHYESRFQLFALDFVYSLKGHKSEFKLNNTNQNKFNNLFYIFYHVFNRGVILIAGNFIYGVNLLVCVYVYLYSEYQLNLSMLIVNFAMFVLAIESVLNSALIPLTLVIIIIAYICRKFDELHHSLMIAIRNQDCQQILVTMRLHSCLTRLCKSFANIFNLVLGLVQMMMPYMTVLSIECLKSEANSKFDVVAKIIFVFDFTMFNLCAYIINQAAASISVRSKGFPKICYKVFLSPINPNHRSYNLRFKLKVEEFIARLNREFIGYQCFNWFKFTKLTSYKYILSIGVTYILVVDFINKF